jgi:SAM-dependent methyltransferase
VSESVRPAADRAPPSVLGPSDAAVFETFVVPRYLSLFGELALEVLAVVEGAQVLHIGCRTGYPDRGILLKMPTARVVGCDPSGPAIELARAKAATTREQNLEYMEVKELPLPFERESFSHAIALHPPADPASREGLLSEMHRVLTRHGQAIVALPMRGSFVEVADLLRECALKADDEALNQAIDQAIALRPTVETLATEMESAGFEYVDVDLRPSLIGWSSGREFLEDPITRLLLLSEFRRNLGVDLDKPMQYVRDAIDKYWSDATFELTVHVGCATGRRA